MDILNNEARGRCTDDRRVARQAARRSNQAAWRSSQGGFTLIELTVVFLVLVVLAVLAVPRVQGLIIENKVPTVAREVTSAVNRIRGARAMMSGNFYAAPNEVSLAELGAKFRDTSFQLTGSPVTAIRHTLGSGANIPGVQVAVVDIGSGGGSGFTVLLQNVDRAGCGPLAASLSNAVEAMAVGPTVDQTFNGAVTADTVKQRGGGAFLASLAQTQCDLAATTNMAFVFR